MRDRALWLIALVCLLNCVAVGQNKEASDPRALEALFSEQHIPASPVFLLDELEGLEPRVAYRELERWILPTSDRDSIRIQCQFQHAIPDDYDPDNNIVSPLTRMLDLAESLSELETLLQKIRQIQLGSFEETIQLDIIEGLIQLRLDDQDRAIEKFRTAFESFLQKPPGSKAACRDAVLLALAACCSSTEAARSVVSLANRIDRSFTIAVNRTPWHLHVFAITQLIQHRSRAINHVTQSRNDRQAKRDQWQWAPQLTAKSIADGVPFSRWRITNGSAQSTQAGAEDSLFFRSPMIGPIDLQATIVGSGFRRGHARVFSSWVIPTIDPNEYELRNGKREYEVRQITPPFADESRSQPIRYRVAANRSDARTYFNGRLIHQQTQAESNESSNNTWIQFRSCFRPGAGIENVRLSPHASVPSEIDLLRSSGLTLWHDFYGTHQGTGRWRLSEEAEGFPQELRSHRDRNLPQGSLAEQLLVYGRPVFEDGTIEYEFWYKNGDAVVHPALGLNAVLIDQEVAVLHQLTLGKFDRTGTRVGNRMPLARAQHLSLEDGAWNQMRIEIEGDQASFFLNDDAIGYLETTSNFRRTFGLFHFSDQSQVRVRNVVWAGDWSRSIPEPPDQSLGQTKDGRTPTATNALAETFTHRFGPMSLSSGTIQVTDGASESEFQAGENGLTVIRPAIANYRDAKLALPISVKGDFDITASFESLDIAPSSNMSGQVMLEVRTDDPMANVGMIQIELNEGSDPFVQSLRTQKARGQVTRRYFNTSMSHAGSGQLKLSRRGDSLYMSFAEHDSSHFNPLGNIPFSDAGILENGIRLGTQIQGKTGHTSVRWKSITVQCESLEQDETLDDVGEIRSIAQLNSEVDNLTEKLSYQFAAVPALPSVFGFWNRSESPGVTFGLEGMTIIAPGTEQYTSAGPVFMPLIDGDFDITVEFDPSGLAFSKQDKDSSMGLQVEFADHKRISLYAQRKSNGYSVNCSVASRSDSGRTKYRNLGKLNQKSDQLRVALRGRTLYLVASNTESRRQSIVSQLSLGSTVLKPNGVRFLVHTGDPTQTSRLLVRRCEIHAMNPIAIPAADLP